MKKLSSIIMFLVASQAAIALAGVHVDVNVGVPVPPPVMVTPPPVYVPPPEPVYVPPPPPAAPGPVVVFESQPRFVYSPALGCYVSVGSPYDMVYVGDYYYLYSGGFWFGGPTFSGPWLVVKRRALPQVLRRFPYERIRYYRDLEYGIYLRDPVHYRGRLHEPAWRHREHRREERWEEHRGRR
jgi:hypothetical protein